MKHVFIINPYAGPQSCEPFVKEQLKLFAGQIDYEVYVKQYKGDCKVFIPKYMDAYPEEEIRFYACGGDGTLKEVACSMVRFPNASFTSYPCGSGNDFIKYYGEKEVFQDFNRLIHGVPTPIDLMSVNGTYAINATHFGLDYHVAKTMNKLRRCPVLGKKLCYPTAVAWSIFTGTHNSCIVYADGQRLNKNEILLCTVANGRYVGGSYQCAPHSLNDDGLLEVCLIDPIPRSKFIHLINSYKKGLHLDDPRCKPYIHYCQAKKVSIIGPDDFGVSLDGELFKSNQINIEAIPRALQFIVPAEK